MDLNRIYDDLRARYEANPSDARALQVSRRIRRTLKRRERRLRALLSFGSVKRPSDIKYLQQHGRRQIERIRQAIEAGLPVICFDAEWTPWRPITEIGLAIYRSGEITHRNIRVLPDYRPKLTTRYRFGETEYMSKDDAQQTMRAFFSEDHVLVGHAINNDRRQMSQWGAPFVSEHIFDTYNYARARYPGEKMSLKSMVERQGYWPKGAHIAGNDAGMVLHVLLCLLERREECIGTLPLSEKPTKNKILTSEDSLP